MTPRPRTSKKKHLIALEPPVMKKLQALSSKYGKPVGDIIEGLVKFAGSQVHTDEEYVRRFSDRLEQCLVSAGTRSGWVGDEAEELIKGFENWANLARQAGDESSAKQAEAQIERLKAEYGI